MDDQLITIIFAIVAGVVFYQLYRVLGQRTGKERPPLDPFSADSQKEKQKTDIESNVITLPQRDAIRPADFSDIDAVAPQGSAVNKGLRAIRRADPAFSVKTFMDGVRIAYEMVLTAFANGDRDTLKTLLAPDVYEGFSSAIAGRQKEGEVVKFSFVGLNKADIAAARCENGYAQISLHFVCEIISVTYDEADKLIDGDPAAIVEVKDLWTFSRDVRSGNPNWLLTATEEDQ